MSSTTNILVVFKGKEYRLPSTTDVELESFLLQLREYFNIEKNEEIILTYKDDENDIINVKIQKDLDTAISWHTRQNLSPKFYLDVKKKENTSLEDSMEIEEGTKETVKESKKEEEKEEEIDYTKLFFRARDGSKIELNCSEDILMPIYGVKPFSQFRTPKGDAYVCGIDTGKKPQLWFRIGHEDAISYWDDVVDKDSLKKKKFDLKREGGTLEDVKPAIWNDNRVESMKTTYSSYSTQYSKPSSYKDDFDELEEQQYIEAQLLQFAEMENEVDQQQKEIQQYYFEQLHRKFQNCN